MRVQEYVCKITGIVKHIDGDTGRLRIDRGFDDDQHKLYWRLDGVDCPELHRGSPFERRQGANAAQFTRNFVEALADGLWLHSIGRDPEGDFGRWLVDIWYEPANSSEERHLADALISLGLATTWPTRWHEVYDPERNRL